MATGARGREHFDRPAKESGRKVRDLKSIGKLLDPGVAANDAVVQSTQVKPPKKKVVKTASVETVSVPQTSESGKAVNPLFTEPGKPPKKKSGKNLAADKAVEAIAEVRPPGTCLICFKSIKETFCGRWLVPEKNEAGKEVMVDRFTCSGDCEKIQQAKPGYLG